jgi:hypothetical protein
MAAETIGSTSMTPAGRRPSTNADSRAVTTDAEKR